MNIIEVICLFKISIIFVRVNLNDVEIVRFFIVFLCVGKYLIEIVVRFVGVGDWVCKMVNVIVSIVYILKIYVYYCIMLYVYLLLNLFFE